MTDQHRATPEQWAEEARWAAQPHSDTDAACILELRARVEGLEKLHSAVVELNERFSLDPLVARVEALEAAQRNAAVDNLWKASAECRPTPPGSLVERVVYWIPSLPDGRADDDAARAAIREVAAWCREQHPSPGMAHVALRLEQEAARE